MLPSRPQVSRSAASLTLVSTTLAIMVESMTAPKLSMKCCDTPAATSRNSHSGFIQRLQAVSANSVATAGEEQHGDAQGR